MLKKLFFSLLGRKEIREKIRFLFVGGLCAVADLLILFILVDFSHVWYLTASIISFFIVSFVGFFGHKYFTFKNYSKRHGTQITIFFMTAGTGLLINSFFMYILVSFLGFWYILGSVITKLIVLLWNFTSSKYFIFNNDFYKITR